MGCVCAQEEVSCASVDLTGTMRAISGAQRIYIGLIEPDAEVLKARGLLQKLLEISGQLLITAQQCDEPKSKQDIHKLFQEGYVLALFMSTSSDKKNILWRLYDPTESVMLKGRSFTKRSFDKLSWVYGLADILWREVMQQQSSFSSYITYSKRKSAQKFVICTNDLLGEQERELLSKPGIYVGLSWQLYGDIPVLFASEFTLYNVRFMSVSLEGRKKVVMNFDGTLVGISCAGNKALYSRSGTIWSYSFDAQTKRGIHKIVVQNEGKNSSPLLLKNGDMIWCSDAPSLCAPTAGPHIFYYHADTKQSDRLTTSGFCVGPAYHESSKRIVYSKRVKGQFQLFVYDMNSKVHEQLTHDHGDKISCSWSPCGNYVLFCVQEGRSSRIAVEHVKLHTRLYVTSSSSYCSYPAWSPLL